MKRRLGYVLMALGLILGYKAEAACPPELRPPPPSITAKYTLKDLGETDIDPSKLTRHSTKLTLAPRVNNLGQVSGNTSKGGFITYPGRWTYAPSYEGMTVYFQGLNNKGDLLVSIHRGMDSVEWMRWPMRNESYGAVREHIQTVDPFVDHFYMSGFSSSNAVGYQKYQDGYYPVSWNCQNGLQFLGSLQRCQIKGKARAVSDSGIVAGIIDLTVDHPPFIWTPSGGVEVMRNYAGILGRGTWIEFSNLVVTDEGIVFGTYWIRHDSVSDKPNSGTNHLVFLWDPCKAEIKKLDLGGMLITAVNEAHVLVGTSQGRAVVRYRNKDPVTVESLVNPDELEGWKLIEATDINDLGQIVGFGTFQGKTHLFLAEPLP